MIIVEFSSVEKWFSVSRDLPALKSDNKSIHVLPTLLSMYIFNISLILKSSQTKDSFVIFLLAIFSIYFCVFINWQVLENNVMG